MHPPMHFIEIITHIKRKFQTLQHIHGMWKTHNVISYIHIIFKVA
jgi:hypothetical protein